MSVDVGQPNGRSVFSSRDPEETTEFFRHMYVGNQTLFQDVTPQSGFTAEFAAADSMRADRLSGALTMRCISEDPLGYVLFGQLQRGRWTLQAGGSEVPLGPGDSVLYPSDTSFQLEAQDFDFAVVSLPLDRVRRMAAEHSGTDEHTVQFESMSPVSASIARHFNQTVALIYRELGDPGSAATNPLVAEQLAQTAAATVLSTFPNTTMTAEHLPGPGHVAPAAIRRAVAFMEEHVAETITVSDIAAAAGTGVRALQHGLSRHYGTTPTGYLLRLRLERAHRDLQAADPATGITVADIAARWGFPKTGRFFTRYRQTYGQTPGDTLWT